MLSEIASLLLPDDTRFSGGEFAPLHETVESVGDTLSGKLWRLPDRLQWICQGIMHRIVLAGVNSDVSKAQD
jgi:hypothetical protein